MGNYSEIYTRPGHPKDIRIKDEEIKYFISDLFGNQFRKRKETYATNSNSINNNIVYNEDSIYNQEFSSETKEELSITNNKRSRDDFEIPNNNNKIMNTPSTNDNQSLSESENNVDNSIPLIEEFKEFSFDNIIDNKKDNVIKLTSKFSIFKDDLQKWKFSIQIQKFSKNFIKSLSGRDDLIKNVNDILKKEYLFDSKEIKIEFLKRLFSLGILKIWDIRGNFLLL